MNEILKSIPTKKKILVALCAVLGVAAIVATSVFATVAYLTSSAAVSNVFTIGKVGITMTESKVDTEGVPVPGAGRVDTNTYHLVPNKTYSKDPTIFVDAGSEDSFLFVLVRNDIQSIEAAGEGTIANQLAENGWQKYIQASTGWVYIYVGTEVADPDSKLSGDSLDGVAFVTEGSYPLFESFSIASNADVSAYGAAKITLTAVAIQHDGFDTIDAAWAAVVATYPYIHTGNNGN